MDLSMHANLVTAFGDRRESIGFDKSRNRGHEEAGFHVVPIENSENARNAAPATELAPRQPSDGRLAHAQLEGFMVAIERQRHGTTGAA